MTKTCARVKRGGGRAALLLMAVAALALSGSAFAALVRAEGVPVIDPRKSSYDPNTGALTIKGENFQAGAAISISNDSGEVGFSRVKVKGPGKIVINGVAEADILGGLTVKVTNPDGASAAVVLELEVSDDKRLGESDVRRIIAQAVARAEASDLKATVAVVDREGNVLGVFRMAGARADTVIGTDRPCRDCGAEGLRVPAELAAISKAGTGAFLSTQGHAFTTRTASFIVQEHFPPGVDFTPGGPLFGVQFSQLPCSDINAKFPLGLSADPGGVPLYKNGLLVGGVGVEGDGRYSLDPDPTDFDMPVEEIAAVAATRGFESPPDIRGNQIIVNGIRLPFVNTPAPPALPPPPFDQLRGELLAEVRSSLPSTFRAITLQGLRGRVDDRFFPFRGTSSLSSSEVQRIIVQGARQAFLTRAAIRRPLGSAAEVNIAVVSSEGTVLGIFSTSDAPMFGFDVSVQKARTAAFFSNAEAASLLRSAEGGKFAKYVSAAARDGVALDGRIAFSNRGQGFLSRPFFPDGINDSEHGPFSVPIEEFSPFNVGLQLDLLLTAISKALMGERAPCTAIPNLGNGIQIFAGSVPLYKSGRLVGAIGVSGDGIDQDDIIAAMGSAGFEAPPEMRSDRVFVRDVRLPFVKFPRNPNR
ncbi:MAG TPA: heme-binding protein [Blastocatellia bacterium]|nr:heme-binding protein [Blastocatellia bacterium]